MVGPSAEKLATMGLLGKKDSISTEIVYLRQDEKREDYYKQFREHNKDVHGLEQVEWGRTSAPTSNGIRCNACIILLSVGAKIPESRDGSRVAKDVPPVIQYPMKALPSGVKST